MSIEESQNKNGILRAISLYNESINNTKLSKISNLFNTIINDNDVNIKNWEIKDYDQFLREIDPINNCQDNKESESEDPIITKKHIPNMFISLITLLQEIHSNDIENQIYSIIIFYLNDILKGDVKDIINNIIPYDKKDLLNEKATAIVTILISSYKALLNEKNKDIKELIQNVLDHANQIDIGDENDKTNNSEYLNFMLSLFSELFGNMELRKVIKNLWEITNGNTEQIAEYISYLLYEHQNNQKEDEGAESKHFGLATRIVVEEYIEPLQQKQRRQLRRNRNKTNDTSNTLNNNVLTEEEAANADLNEIYSFIKQVLHYTCLDDDQNGYPKELALFFSSFQDFWEPDMILKFMVKEINEKNIEENYKEYYGPFLMDLADLMNWTNKQCETALLILTEGWKRKSRISIAKMMGLSLNDIKHLYSDCKDLTYNDGDYLSDDEEGNTINEVSNKENVNDGRDFSKTKKPVVLSIRGSDFKRSFTKVLTDKDNTINGGNNNTICRYYGTPRGCSSGKHCPFKHVQTRSSYITRRLNHSTYTNPNPAFNNRLNNNNNVRFHHNPNLANMNNTLKHRTSYQNINNYRNPSSRTNPIIPGTTNDIGKNRMNNRITIIPPNDSMIKLNKKGEKIEPHFVKKEVNFNHKLRKQASFITPSSYRNQTQTEYKPIEAIDPAISQHNHNNIICYYYNDPRGCSNGKNCKFLHINANSFNNNGNNGDNRGNYNTYDNNGPRKPFNTLYNKPFNPTYGNNNYNGPDGMNKGHQIIKKPSRHILRNNDLKLKQEFNNYKKPNMNDDTYLKNTRNMGLNLRNEENSNIINNNNINNNIKNNNTFMNNNYNNANPTSITIVNSSQNNNEIASVTSSKEESQLMNETLVTNNEPNVNINNIKTNISTTIASNSKAYSQTPCVFFSKEGSCKYGNKCKFLHNN